jgi:hypothetical protein
MMDELERMWDEVVVVCCKILPWYLSGESEENHVKISG